MYTNASRASCENTHSNNIYNSENIETIIRFTDYMMVRLKTEQHENQQITNLHKNMDRLHKQYRRKDTRQKTINSVLFNL